MLPLQKCISSFLPARERPKSPKDHRRRHLKGAVLVLLGLLGILAWCLQINSLFILTLVFLYLVLPVCNLTVSLGVHFHPALKIPGKQRLLCSLSQGYTATAFV
jgi:hypothetical protein